jgi:hypothetical protein
MGAPAPSRADSRRRSLSVNGKHPRGFACEGAGAPTGSHAIENRCKPIPFFIEWAADSEHPSRDSPPGCRLISLALAYPDPPAVRKALGSLGIGIELKQRSTARLQALLDTPKGNVTLI